MLHRRIIITNKRIKLKNKSQCSIRLNVYGCLATKQGWINNVLYIVLNGFLATDIGRICIRDDDVQKLHKLKIVAKTRLPT